MCGNGATRSLRTAFNTKAYRAAASGADTRPSRNPRQYRMYRCSGWHGGGVPWRPPFEHADGLRNARLDPYRERAGVIFDDADVEFAKLFLRVETYSTRLGGILWARRWSAPFEVVHGFMKLADGRFDDWLSWDSHLDVDLHDWANGRFAYIGTEYRVRWLDDVASADIRRSMNLDDS